MDSPSGARRTALNPPPGYPRDFERSVVLHDGRRMWVRPILPGDAPTLAAAVRTADADTLRARFLGTPPTLNPARLARLTTVDYHRRFALVAMDPVSGKGIAIGRYEPAGAGVAEIAVAVDPAWRRIGVATALIELLALAAIDRGVHAFTVSYLAGNRPVATLLARAGAGRRLIRQGIADALVALDRDEVTAALDTLLGNPRHVRPSGSAVGDFRPMPGTVRSGDA